MLASIILRFSRLCAFHRAFAAFLLIALRRSGVIDALRASPPREWIDGFCMLAPYLLLRASKHWMARGIARPALSRWIGDGRLGYEKRSLIDLSDSPKVAQNISP